MREYPSLIGQRFGMLTVIDRAESSPQGHRRWLCLCDCGKEAIVIGSNLKRGTTVSCGCKKRKDLTGQRIGNLTVLERSDQYGSRGQRKRQLWKCRCDCGEITYKATDTLTNGDVSMCKVCAGRYAANRARAEAGYDGGTQITKIKVDSNVSDNLSGVRGVYYDERNGTFRARIKFRGEMHDLGTYRTLEDAVKARKRGEEAYYETYLAEINQ